MERVPADDKRGTVDPDYGRAIEEQVTYLAVGPDGLSTDQADIGVLAPAELPAR